MINSHPTTATHTDASTSPSPANARHRVRHAIFPVAGFGASFLPATKACPKEMLPIVDRPMIQYAVEEAAAAGITRMIFITARGKRAIEDHFDRAYELERELVAREDDEALRELRGTIPAGVSFSYVRQRETTGLLDALLKARSLVGDEPFAVLLPDQLIDAEPGALAQLLDVFDEQCVSVVGAERIAPRSADPACFISADLRTSAVRSARALVKVPPIGAASAPVNLSGRFVFTSAIWGAIETATEGSHPRTLVSAIRALMERERVFACLIDGRRFDCSTKLGFMQAQFAFAQKRAELWSGLRRSLAEILDKGPGAREHGPAPALTSTTSTAATRRQHEA